VQSDPAAEKAYSASTDAGGTDRRYLYTSCKLCPLTPLAKISKLAVYNNRTERIISQLPLGPQKQQKMTFGQFVDDDL